MLQDWNEPLLYTDDELARLLSRPLLPVAPVESLAGRSIAVTGAAGSIGSELCKRIVELGAASLVCLDRDETAVFYLEKRLPAEGSSTRLFFVVEDYSSSDAVQSVLQRRGVDTVIHAAAYKHLALMERSPGSALRNNVFGLLKLLDCCEETGVKSFLLLSSDKAVDPQSVMGCTKRLGEMILASRPQTDLQSLSVRFGNVLGSQGSVLPVWLEQIRRRQPITVTDADATRYFIAPSEAASLLLQSVSLGVSGQTLVLDVAPPTRLMDLAQRTLQSQALSREEYPIIFTGLSAGEKLHEELFSMAEQRQATPHPHIAIAESPPMQWQELSALVQALEEISFTSSRDELRFAMASIVPEYEF